MEIDNAEAVGSEKDEEIGSNSDSDGGSRDSDSDSESEEIKENKIKELFEKITSNPYHYDSHLELITLLRKGGELEQLRIARDQMSRLFPLTPELWMEWLTDEAIVSSQKEDQDQMITLFEKAVKDYLSVSVWLEYVQYSIGQMSTDPPKVREIFERALTAVGLHVVDGSMIWDAYREFEIAIMATLQAKEEAESKELSQQKTRVLNLFRRQLSVPLQDMEKTYQEYEDWIEGEPDAHINSVYKKTLKYLMLITPFEDSLITRDPPRLAEYLIYLDYEEEEGTPARVQCIYERALVENCLLPDLWLRYGTYLDTTLKMDSVSLPVYERAVRNCPWAVSLWISYITAAERYKMERDKVKNIVDAAFQSGLTGADDFRALWTAYLHYLRRSIQWDTENEKELEQLRTVFQKASDHLNQSFLAEGDPTCSILRYWAKTEAKFCKNITKAREIWNMILHSGPKKADAETWVEYANLERTFGDDKRYRKTLHRALCSVNDWPETIGELLITFEKEEGTLETLDAATEKYAFHLARVNEKRKMLAIKENRENSSPKYLSGRKDSHFKRKHGGGGEDNAIDSDGFLIPRPRGPKSPQTPTFEDPPLPPEPKKFKGAPKEKQTQNSKQKRSADETRSENDQTTKMTNPPLKVIYDPSKDKQTVFVSNLDYSTDENQIKEIFSTIGEIEEVRLVRSFKGISKGYCYVQFASIESVKPALEKDRERVQGRPMFVSPCKDKTKQTQGDAMDQKFKFNTSLEKNKLFVKGLPFSTTEKEVEELFKQYGEVKQTRLATYRNGNSKGFAYVDFVDQSAATTALLKTDNMEVGGQVISVAYSNPPPRKPREGGPRSHLLSSSTRDKNQPATAAGRGRGRIQMVPRSLQRPPPGGNNAPPIVTNGDVGAASPSLNNPPSEASPSNGVKNKMSNADFRNLLKK